jgi:hypothetical protein
MTRKLSTQLKNFGHSAKTSAGTSAAARSDGTSGTLISKTNRVMAMAKMPSLKKMSRSSSRWPRLPSVTVSRCVLRHPPKCLGEGFSEVRGTKFLKDSRYLYC